MQGSTLRADREADGSLYRSGVDRKSVLDGKVGAPKAAQPLVLGG
ncbi:MAG: hypothetical protein HXY18_02240 [Bryobacteraceae bacterium]|jgi:lipid-binding SYLF domain-containing protein|nr:hypothetical protein [Bryobacteraceae bacterium]